MLKRDSEISVMEKELWYGKEEKLLQRARTERVS